MSGPDMVAACAPKSDQLNADDLTAGPMTIRIVRVTGNQGEKAQPVSIHWEGGEGRPYKPCKSMCRVLVEFWGARAENYVGRSLTLYRDPSVTFGGIATGGIRISHMSHLGAEQVSTVLTVSKAQRKPYKIGRIAEQASRPAEDEAVANMVKFLGRTGVPAEEALKHFGKTSLAELTADERQELKRWAPEFAKLPKPGEGM